MADFNKILRGLRQCTMRDCRFCPYDSIGVNCSMYLFDDVMGMLETLEPRVMTLDELLDEDEYVGLPGCQVRPVWLEDRKQLDACIIRFTPLRNEFNFVQICNFGTSDTVSYQQRGYGKTWRVWTARPNNEERKAVKWE